MHPRLKTSAWLTRYLFTVFYLISFLLAGIPALEAQIKPSYFNDFKHYTDEDGLPTTYISAIREDKNGFLWIATGNGVSRFDGHHFTNFTHYFADSIQHKMGFVGSIVFDRSGKRIWLGSSGGILYSSVDSVNFQPVERLIPSMKGTNKRNTDLLTDDGKILWAAGNKNGLLKIDLPTKEYRRFTFTDEMTKGKFLLNGITCLAKDPANHSVLWLGTTAGLIRFNSNTNAYQIYVYGNNTELAQNRIRTIMVSGDKVFLGTWSKGLIIFDKKTGQFHQLLKDEDNSRNLLILDLYTDKDSGLWITTAKGLILYDMHNRAIKTILENDEAKGILRGVSFVDSRGITWYCSGKGLFKFDPLQFHYEFVELEKRNEIQYALKVRKIIQSGDAYYVLGHSASGLYKVNAKTHSVEIINYPYLKSGKGPNTTLRDMIKMENGDFLVLSGSEITLFNPQTGQIRLSPLQIVHPFPSIQYVVRDRDHNYWIGTRAAGLFRMNFNRHSIKNFRKEFDAFGEGSYSWINRLFIDSGNRLWIAKGSTSVMNLNDNTVFFLSPEEKKNIFFFQDVNGFCEDRSGKIWMAGGPDGLGFTNIENFRNGVSRQVEGYFSGVFPYNDTLLWTTGKILGIFNLNNMTHREMRLSAGNKKLKVSGPVIPAGNGEFAIGCDNGVLFYNPEEQVINSEVPVPYIRKIISDGKTVYEGNNLAKADFTFESGTKHIIFTISSLGFHLSDQITYQYRFDNEWQNIGNNDEIHLTNLSYGDYPLEIRASNEPGSFTGIPKVYHVSILTPWWATWWAFILYLGIAVFFADRFYRFQLSKRLAIAESNRLKDVNELKSSLYANITHEFRTPLTVILGMVDSIKTGNGEQDRKTTKHAMDMIRRNGRNMLRLVNEMLDLSKLESGKMELQLILSDVIPFIKYLCEGFHSLAKEKQVNFMVYSEVDKLLMDFDANKLSAILSNLLSNALKFTPPGGNIIVHLNRTDNQKDNLLIIKVKDTGPGIPEENIPHIFDRFYQVNNNSASRNGGTGLGLALTREFVEMMNGTIEVKSKTGHGSEFIIQLPVTNNAAKTRDILTHLTSTVPVFVNGEKQLQPVQTDQPELPLALIIEDNADVAHYLQTCLAGKYKTIHELNGETGIETATEKIPDVIICDVMMPGKDGFAVCSELKSDERTDHIPVILLTAKVTVKDRITGLSCGADAYLTKPFVKAELLTRLDQLVLQRKKIMQKMENGSVGHFLKVRAENPETKFLQKIIRIIHEEISNHSFGSSAQLARKMHLSESQIYRKLKAITGKSTAVFIRSVRLQKAKEFIQTSDKSISEIAYEVGFNDPSWFSRAFKEEFGYSPNAISK